MVTAWISDGTLAHMLSTYWQAAPSVSWSMPHSASNGLDTTSTYTLHTMIQGIVLMRQETVRWDSSAFMVISSSRQASPGTLHVHHVRSPFPRSIKGKFHILFAHLRQLHLTQHLLRTNASSFDVFFVDQLSTCVPFIRHIARRRVVFYCHFPDKLLSDGEFIGVDVPRRKGGYLKRIYRLPMDWLEEQTTGAFSCFACSDREVHDEHIRKCGRPPSELSIHRTGLQ